MKKKSLKNLNVKKTTVSNLNKGGAAIRTYYTVCGTGPQTIVCTYNCPSQLCTLLIDCDTYNSQNRCKTIEVDPTTLPIC
ncbi:hypothetical protein [Kordia jejudonensis]|uniref:hypothetical protein n=1 Tax=Kordia jejudonensis TaxID=1348245 RepID=UPI000629BD95|nr:hypothetical protein [Kordia jejudonensis]